MAAPMVYIHEEVEILGHHRAAYMEHVMTWAATGRAERNMRCVGTWATVGSTERWPQVMNMWELDGWDALASSFRHELSHPGHQDPSLVAWWATAAEYRRGGCDRILVPTDYTRSLADLMTGGVRGEVYMHEVVTTCPGRVHEYLGCLGERWLPRARELGMELVGAYRHAMVDDSEAIVMWAVPTWETWAATERAIDNGAERTAWRAVLGDIVRARRRKLLAPHAHNPLETGVLP